MFDFDALEKVEEKAERTARTEVNLLFTKTVGEWLWHMNTKEDLVIEMLLHVFFHAF